MNTLDIFRDRKELPRTETEKLAQTSIYTADSGSRSLLSTSPRGTASTFPTFVRSTPFSLLFFTKCLPIIPSATPKMKRIHHARKYIPLTRQLLRPSPLQFLIRHIPKLRLLVLAADQTPDIKWIEDREDPRPIVGPARALTLCLPVTVEEDGVGAWQAFTRVPDIQHDGIDEHDGRLEDPEVDFVLVHV